MSVTAMTPLWKPLVVAIPAVMLLAAVGGALTDLGPWYYDLRQPAWKPPDWLFGPAWTVIFALTAVAAAQTWRRVADPARRARLAALFVVNGVLNMVWSLLFFRLQRPEWALAEVLLLWLSILMLIVTATPYWRPAAWLLAPYFVWVTFAATVNAAVVHLNRGLGRLGRTGRMTRTTTKGEMTMRTMNKLSGAVRYARDDVVRPAARAGGPVTAGASSAATRPALSLPDRVKTFVDRTLDAARGRYDM